MAEHSTADSAQGSPYRQSFAIEEVQSFSRWLRSRERTGITFYANVACERSFIPDIDIIGFFGRYLRPQSEADTWGVESLVSAATQNNPVDPEDVARHCPKVFAILTCIGYPEFIYAFVGEDQLQDRRLPFGSDKKALFPFVEPGQTFFDDFEREQWRFCVEELKFGHAHMTFDGRQILPIKKVTAIERGVGVSAIVHKIVIHGEYDSLKRSRDRSRSDSLVVKEEQEDLHTYVIKSYHLEDGDRYFKSEVRTFQVLNHADKMVPNVVGFYKAFKQNDSLNIILQYANVGTLEAYLEHVRSPRSKSDILKVWRKMSRLNTAVAGIHEYAPRGKESPSEPSIFQGWHQDVKPANILVIGDIKGDPYNVEFLLADLGLSHFTAVAKDKAGTTGEDMPGPRPYGAPEKNLHETLLSDYLIESKQKLDVWALGGVYSEFTTWVVQDWDGLQKYRDKRGMEVDSTELGPVFHDKAEGQVLDCVLKHHEQLAQESSRTDCITPSIWDQILKRIFTRRHVRITAPQLEHYMNLLLEQAEKETPPAILQLSNSVPANVNAGVWGAQPRPQTPDQLPPGFEKSFPFTPPSGDSSQPRDLAWTQHSGSLVHSPDSHVLEGEASVIDTSSHDPAATVPLPTSSGFRLPEASPPRMLHQGARRATDSQQFPSTPAAAYEEPGLTENSRSERAKLVALRNTIPRHYYQVSYDSEVQAEVSASTGQTFDLDVSTKGKAPAHTDHNTQTSKKELSKRPPPPELTVKQLSYWAKLTRESKNSLGGFSFGGSKDYLLTGDTREADKEAELLEKMRERDYIFILDDSASMSTHWSRVKDLYANLILMVKKKQLDPDGGQLLFITSDYADERINTTKLVDAVMQHKFKLKGTTNFAKRINKVLGDYLQKLRKDYRTPPISIYVLTDGVWETQQGTKSAKDYHLEQVADAIGRAVKVLDEHAILDKRIGIQFVRFGDDKIGKKRLRYLDAKLKRKKGLSRDICDTTLAEGNVWKMMLGSIDPAWDDDSDDDDDDDDDTDEDAA